MPEQLVGASVHEVQLAASGAVYDDVGIARTVRIVVDPALDVLGILALSGFAPMTLVLIALLGLGCFTTLSSAFIAGAFARAFQVAQRS